ncbi:MAG: putative thiol:disulfide interchange protein DsbC precursor [Pseudomonadota bacterium]|jgi:thiol:disulfide interchange protein DsbC
MKNLFKLSLLALSLLAAQTFAQEDVIRKNLAERIPKLPKIDEISKSPMAGLFEIRVGGTDIYYTDAGGNFLIDGQLIDAKSGKNLTEERLNKLSAIDFKDLPLQDAFVIKRGNGARKIAVFEDPNCGYCKRFEADLQKVNNVTVYMFLYPILGQDSSVKSKNIWCASDKAKAWQDWMLKDGTPRTQNCNTDAIVRNVEFGKKHRITGTPTLLLVDGTRIPGAIGSTQLEKMLADVKTN